MTSYRCVDFCLDISIFGLGPTELGTRLLAEQNDCCFQLLFSFLASRRQKEKLNGMFSDCEILNHCVPVGTVLGPLFFLSYVNDFSSNIQTTGKVIQFADDTSVCCRTGN